MIDEGYIKFELDWQAGPPPDAAQVAELNRWRRPLFAAGLIGVYEEQGVGFGNLSVRSRGDGLFVISGTQTGHLDELGPEHCALVTDYDIDGNRVRCRGPVRASSESMTHAALYELADDIGAVVHVHSGSLWRRFRGILPTTRPEVAYGTPEMAREFRRLYRETDFADRGLAIMAGHEEGIVGTGHGIAQAAGRILELAAHAADGVPGGSPR